MIIFFSVFKDRINRQSEHCFIQYASLVIKQHLVTLIKISVCGHVMPIKFYTLASLNNL